MSYLSGIEIPKAICRATNNAESRWQVPDTIYTIISSKKETATPKAGKNGVTPDIDTIKAGEILCSINSKAMTLTPNTNTVNMT